MQEWVTLGTVLEGEDPIFLQAVGRRPEDAERTGRTPRPEPAEGHTWDEMRVNLVRA